jgi:hypothetical protein
VSGKRKTPRELARGERQPPLDLDPDGRGARQQMNERRRAPHAGAEVHEDVRRTDACLIHHPKERVHGARKVRDAAPGEIRSVVRKPVKTEDRIQPGISRRRSDAEKRPPKLAWLMQPAIDERARSLRRNLLVRIHGREA